MQDPPQSLVLKSNRIDGMAGSLDAARAAFRLSLGAMVDDCLPAAASSMLVRVEPNAHSSFALQVTPFEMEAVDSSGGAPAPFGGVGGLRLLISTGTDASGGRQVYDLWRFVGMGTPGLSTILSTTVANIDTLNVNNLTVNGTALGVGGGGSNISGYAVPHWSTNHLSAAVALITSLSSVSISSNTVEAEWVYGRVLQTSDARLKCDVEGVENGLSILRALRPVFFNWRDGSATTRTGFKDLGFLAQQTEAALPHVVSCQAGPGPTAEGGGLRRVNYAQLTALLAAGVQEQAVQVEALTERVGSLEARMENVERAFSGARG